jgi:hypothetical protein
MGEAMEAEARTRGVESMKGKAKGKEKQKEDQKALVASR